MASAADNVANATLRGDTRHARQEWEKFEGTADKVDKTVRKVDKTAKDTSDRFKQLQDKVTAAGRSAETLNKILGAAGFLAVASPEPPAPPGPRRRRPLPWPA